MTFRREQLLGYLLGALDAAESRQVEAELDKNPALRVEMARYQELLSRLGMDEEPEEFEPPRGLADRTCDFIAAHGDAVYVVNWMDDNVSVLDANTGRLLRQISTGKNSRGFGAFIGAPLPP